MKKPARCAALTAASLAALFLAACSPIEAAPSGSPSEIPAAVPSSEAPVSSAPAPAGDTESAPEENTAEESPYFGWAYFSEEQKEIYRRMQAGEDPILFDKPMDYGDIFYLKEAFFLNEEQENVWGTAFYQFILLPELEERYTAISYDEQPYGNLEDGTREYFQTEGCVTGLRWENCNDPGEEARVMAALDAAVGEAMRALPDREAPDAEKARALAEYLCGLLYYDSSCPYLEAAHALTRHCTVCGGYANAFSYLARQLGLRCFCVDGEGRFTGEAHTWNLCEVDGSWYHIDLTWMDTAFSGEEIDWRYFLVSDETILLDHIYDPAQGCADPTLRMPAAPADYPPEA